jgi:hypothetical protein
MGIVMQKNLILCNLRRNLAVPPGMTRLRTPHGYARLDPDR